MGEHSDMILRLYRARKRRVEARAERARQRAAAGSCRAGLESPPCHLDDDVTDGSAPRCDACKHVQPYHEAYRAAALEAAAALSALMREGKRLEAEASMEPEQRSEV